MKQLSLKFADDPSSHTVSFFSPLPMQYLGGKSRIASWILNLIKTHLNPSDHFLDIFGGTGVVSLEAAKNEYVTHANDIQLYSYNVLRSLIRESRRGIPEVIFKLNSLDIDSILIEGQRIKGKTLLSLEDDFFNNYGKPNYQWSDYQDFCLNTPLVNGNNSKTQRLGKKNNWNLFLNYYANTYFGVRQCLQLDAIRQLAELLPPDQKIHLLASTISIMTYAVSSTTHLAQYLKPSNKKRAENLLKKRKINIIKGVLKRLLSLQDLPLTSPSSSVTCLNYKQALTNFPLDKSWVVYVDPPYFKEHYSRYYHVLETFCLYDYPELSINPQTKTISKGRYRKERFISDFGLKGSALEAFSCLLNYCKNKGAKVAISYSDSSLISINNLVTLSKEIGYKCTNKKIPLMHSGQGQPRNRNVNEHLILLS